MILYHSVRVDGNCTSFNKVRVEDKHKCPTHHGQFNGKHSRSVHNTHNHNPEIRKSEINPKSGNRKSGNPTEILSRAPLGGVLIITLVRILPGYQDTSGVPGYFRGT